MVSAEYLTEQYTRRIASTVAFRCL